MTSPANSDVGRGARRPPSRQRSRCRGCRPAGPTARGPCGWVLLPFTVQPSPAGERLKVGKASRARLPLAWTGLSRSGSRTSMPELAASLGGRRRDCCAREVRAIERWTRGDLTTRRVTPSRATTSSRRAVLSDEPSFTSDRQAALATATSGDPRPRVGPALVGSSGAGASASVAQTWKGIIPARCHHNCRRFLCDGASPARLRENTRSTGLTASASGRTATVRSGGEYPLDPDRKRIPTEASHQALRSPRLADEMNCEGQQRIVEGTEKTLAQLRCWPVAVIARAGGSSARSPISLHGRCRRAPMLRSRTVSGSSRLRSPVVKERRCPV